MTAETDPSPTRDSDEQSSKGVIWRQVLAAFLGAVVGVIAVRLMLFGFTGKSGFAEKTLWDYLDVFLVPVVVAVATFWLTVWENRRQRKDQENQQKLQDQADQARARDEALQAYLDQMSTLLLEKDLRSSTEDNATEASKEARTLARARTLTVLTRLDGERRAQVVQFLYESGLLLAKGRPVVNLRGANLSGADLSGAILNVIDLSMTDLTRAKLVGADLSGADLRWAHLSGAVLTQAILSEAALASADLSGSDLRGAILLNMANLGGANLSGADLRWALLPGALLMEADLSRADLSGAVLSGAILGSAVLSGAVLSGAILQHANLGLANLSGANLSEADLSRAYLSEADLSGAEGITNEKLELQAYSLEGATMPNGQKYEEWLKDEDGSGKDVENSTPS
jgi:uncharacterized protein YjbI with pentapeptide repeats